MPAPKKDETAAAFIKGHGDPDADKAPEKMDAKEPTAQNGYGPHEDDTNRNGRLYVASGVQGHDHAHVDGPSHFQEDVDEHNVLSQLMDFQITRKKGKDRIAVKIDEDAQGPGKNQGNKNREFHLFINLLVVIGPFEVADKDLGGHGKGLGIKVADHRNDVGIDLCCDDSDTKEIDKHHERCLG